MGKLTKLLVFILKLSDVCIHFQHKYGSKQNPFNIKCNVIAVNPNLYVPVVYHVLLRDQYVPMSYPHVKYNLNVSFYFIK